MILGCTVFTPNGCPQMHTNSHLAYLRVWRTFGRGPLLGGMMTPVPLEAFNVFELHQPGAEDAIPNCGHMGPRVA